MELLEDLISRGGWVMYPLTVCSLCALGLILERCWTLRRIKVLPRAFLASVDRLLEQSQYQEAFFLAQDGRTPAARLIRLGLKITSSGRILFKETMEEAGRREALALNARLPILSLLASVAPLLGLLGTVSGMIKAFSVIAGQGLGNPGLLAGGISEALLSTAAGLCVAIPTLVAHRILAARAAQLIGELEDLGHDLMVVLAEPASTFSPVQKPPILETEMRP